MLGGGGVSVPWGGWRVRWLVVDWEGGLMRVWRGEVALSVQVLMCDSCRGVAGDGESGRFLDSAWRGCGLVAGLWVCVSLGLAFCGPLVCGVGWWWWLDGFVGGSWGVDVWSVCGWLFRY